MTEVRLVLNIHDVWLQLQAGNGKGIDAHSTRPIIFKTDAEYHQIATIFGNTVQ